MQVYSDETREEMDTALPDVEVFWAYVHECTECGASRGLVPDYYGLLYQEREVCDECDKVGTLRVVDTHRKFYYWYCFPGCLPDSEPIGPFDTENEAIEDARA